MENPLVSIIIATYNRQEYIRRAVESVLSQTYQNIELIIVDDGSADQTREVIKPYLENPKITYIYQKNQGVSKARNNGTNFAKGKYIAPLDSDDFWSNPKKLEKQIRFLEEHPDYILVGGGIIKIDKKNEEIARYIFPEKDNDIRKSILIDSLFAHSTVLFRKDAWEKVQGYDEAIDFFPDLDLWLKLGKIGKFYNFPEYFVHYLEPEAKRSDYKVRRRLILNLKIRTKYRKDYPSFIKAVLFCLTNYLYSFLPFKKNLRTIFFKLRKMLFGFPAYKRYIQPPTTFPQKKWWGVKVCQVSSVSLTMRFLLLGDIQFLKREGFEVSGICSKGKWVKEIQDKGINVKTITIKRKITPFSDLITLFKLWFYFEKENFDIVHTHTPKAALLGQIAAWLAGVPIIINTIHGYYFTEHTPPLKRKLFMFIEKIVALFSDLIFFRSQEDIETTIKEKIAPAKKIRLLTNGIDLEKFNPQRFPPDFIEKKKKNLGLDSQMRIIGIAARLVKEKGFLDLFEAFQKVIKRFPQTLLLVVGPEDPEKKDSFNFSIVKDYDIENNVKFLGLRKDIDEIYPLMDIFVLPSYREGFGLSIIEASAMRKPVIATNIRGCREAVDPVRWPLDLSNKVEHGKTGILVPIHQPEKLSEAIIYLLENPERAEILGNNGRKKAEREFNKNQMFNKMKIEYQRLIKEKL